MTYPWFRWYRGTCSDTKFRLIALEYGVPTAVVVGAWAALLECVTERHGTVTLASSHASHKKVCQYLQASLDIPENDSVDIVDGLLWQGLITETDEKVSVVNWEKRQTFDTTGAERAKRYRERKRHGVVTASSRDTESDTDTESNSIKEKTKAKKKAPTQEPRGAHLCPEDWLPSKEDLQWAVDKGYDPVYVNEAHEQMIDWSRGNGKKRSDWQRVWRNWLRRNGTKSKAVNSYQARKEKINALADGIDYSGGERCSKQASRLLPERGEPTSRESGGAVAAIDYNPDWS